jgi:hypothetical protein
VRELYNLTTLEGGTLSFENIPQGVFVIYTLYDAWF